MCRWPPFAGFRKCCVRHDVPDVTNAIYKGLAFLSVLAFGIETCHGNPSGEEDKMLCVVVNGTTPVCIFSPRPFWFQQALCWALDVQCCHQEGVVAACDGATACFAALAFSSIMDEKVVQDDPCAMYQEV